MRSVTPAIGLAVVFIVGAPLVLARQAPAPGAAGAGARGAGPQIVWSPKAVTPSEWTPPHRPDTRLAEVLARHAGERDWAETIVDDETLHAAYVSMRPGGRTPRRANIDTREWWVIQDGAIRFAIDGLEPFVASKGYLVQVPYRTFYTMETIGDRPSLRFEVNEGLETFIADQGDVVYVPKQRWHLASFAGEGPSARLAMNGYPDLAHSFEADAAR